METKIISPEEPSLLVEYYRVSICQLHKLPLVIFTTTQMQVGAVTVSILQTYRTETPGERLTCVKSAHGCNHWAVNPSFLFHLPSVVLKARRLQILTECQVFRLAMAIYVYNNVKMTSDLITHGTSWSHGQEIINLLITLGFLLLFLENLDCRRPWSKSEKFLVNSLNPVSDWLFSASFYFMAQKHHSTVKMPRRNMLKDGEIAMLFHTWRN